MGRIEIAYSMGGGREGPRKKREENAMRGKVGGRKGQKVKQRERGEGKNVEDEKGGKRRLGFGGG